MTGFYAELADLASGVLAEFQQGTVKYIAPGVASGSDWDPQQAAGAEHEVKAVVSGVAAKYVDNTHIYATDLQVTMPTFAAVPTLEGSLSIDGFAYQIVQIIPVPAAGDVIVWKMIVRA